MNKRIKKKRTRMINKHLCERYPFLIPRNRFTDQILWEDKSSWYYCYPYSFTELDEMPHGWRCAFGIQMCEEIKEELIKSNHLKEYRIMQIKEKYGGLRWYDSGASKQVHDIIYKYMDLSERTCISCGRPATKISLGWIRPFL